jgi:signal transduction histidine kinase
MTMRHPASLRSIRNRLFLLLLRAFAIVIAFLVLFTLLATGLVLANPSQSNPLRQLAIIPRLESYYIGHGSWDGVTVVFSNSMDIESSQWQSSILLDPQGRIIVNRGMPVSPSLVILYQPSGNETVIPITDNGVIVGQYVLVGNASPPERRFTFRFLQPVLLVSLILAVFAALIGLLLMRRVVSPLAEVIVAAEEIAGGNLKTRVKKTPGPDDLRDLSDSFNKMADALERDDRERRDMLADIAHELRTPLTVMRGRLEGIMDGIYPADEEHVGPALEETYLLERLVDDLRLLTLAESRQLTFEKQSVDLNELARRVISIFQAQADESQIQLSVQSDSNDVKALLDPERTEQVIGNLVNNALRYIPSGGRVWIETHHENDRTSISVSDNGPGIPEEDLPFVFNRFWRGDRSRSRASGGIGLGLAIARQLVEAQGGSISARNLPGGGLQVRCEFPAA